VKVLWEHTTAPGAKGVLQLIMDLSRRAWSGSVARGRFMKGNGGYGGSVP